jgi:hypothetical protein
MNNKSSHGGNKRKQRKYHVSYAESGGTNGCMSHTETVDHTTNECRVLQKQVQKMKEKWDAQTNQKQSNKHCKTNNSNNHREGHQDHNGGDLHTCMGQLERVKESHEKVLKQQQRKSGKCKHEETRVQFTGDDSITPIDEQDDPDDNFICELDQPSLSDDDINDLEKLKPGELSE